MAHANCGHPLIGCLSAVPLNTCEAIQKYFEGGIKGFIFKGTNGRWRDVLNEDDLSSYQQRAAELLPKEGH